VATTHRRAATRVIACGANARTVGLHLGRHRRAAARVTAWAARVSPDEVHALHSVVADALRKPFLVAALLLIGLVVALEVGSSLAVRPGDGTARVADVLSRSSVQDDLGDLSGEERGRLRATLLASAGDTDPPGRAIPALAFVDGLLLWSLLWMAANLLVAERVTGRLQGIATLVLTVLLLLGGIVFVFFLLAELFFMIGLLVSVPFGTIAYLALYGFFPVGSAAGLLDLILVLKLAFCACLLLASHRFLKGKALLLLIATSLLLTVVIGFLHALFPRFLVSIVDSVAGIVTVVVGLVWAIVLLVFAVVSIVRVLRVDRVLPSRHAER